MIMRDPKKGEPKKEDGRKPLTLVTVIGGVIKQTVWHENEPKPAKQGEQDASK